MLPGVSRFFLVLVSRFLTYRGGNEKRGFSMHGNKVETSGNGNVSDVLACPVAAG